MPAPSHLGLDEEGIDLPGGAHALPSVVLLGPVVSHVLGYLVTRESGN